MEVEVRLRRGALKTTRPVGPVDQGSGVVQENEGVPEVYKEDDPY